MGPITNKLAIIVSILILGFGLLSCEKNYPPHIRDTTFTRTPGNYTTSFVLTVEASDPNLDELTFLWEAADGSFDHPDRNETTWTGPESITDKEYDVSITVSDGKESVTEVLKISVVAPRYGNLSGFAYFAKCLVPIHEAIISIDNKRDTTDIEGAFIMDGIKGGRQTLSGSKDGFATVSVDIQMFEGFNEANIHLSSEEFTSTISGQCVGNRSGEAKSWLEIIILNPSGSDSELKALSDGAGYYEIPNVPHGARRLIVRDEAGNMKMETQIYIDEQDRVFDVPIKEPFSFTDTRDNRSYLAVKIKSQTWMAENLAYAPHVSPQWEQGGIWVYGYSGNDTEIAKSSDNYKKYGCLYDYHTAVSDDYGNGKDICPPGWHLPDDSEWKVLEVGLGMDQVELDSVSWRLSGYVGVKLKNDSGWENEGNGHNSSSFYALPAGNRTTAGTYLGIFGFANFWCANESDDNNAWRRYLYYNREGVGRYTDLKGSGISVRCVKDL